MSAIELAAHDDKIAQLARQYTLFIRQCSRKLCHECLSRAYQCQQWTAIGLSPSTTAQRTPMIMPLFLSSTVQHIACTWKARIMDFVFA